LSRLHIPSEIDVEQMFVRAAAEQAQRAGSKTLEFDAAARMVEKSDNLSTIFC
jgi:hypothetical protein